MKRLYLLLSVFALSGMLLFGWLRLVSAATTPTACTQPPTAATQILAIYVLAFDNDPTITNTANLSYQYTATVQGIVAATAANPSVRAVMLSDLDGSADTQLHVAAGGTLTTLDCLPAHDGLLTDSITEYDTTDGQSLGGYLLWAQATYPSTRNLFSYIGHGSFFAADTVVPISQLLESPQTGRALSPLPDRTMVNPNYSDFHLPDEQGHRLITPHDLATAFAIAAEGGGERFDVIDLLHCFAGSIEEFYELRDYAGYITGSPNYAFFDPAMPGTALGGLSTAHSAENFAQFILLAYQSLIPSTQHPFIALGIQTDQLQTVKSSWDALSAALLAEFDSNPTLTADRIELAYTNSFQYDTTFCDDPSELVLAPPDALSDMQTFSAALASEFAGTDVASRASAAQTAIYDSLPFNQTYQEGSPWFYEGMGAAPVWEWSGGGEALYSLFTPFQLWTAESGEQYHTWQSLWYTSTPVYDIGGTTTISNPNPYEFIQVGDAEVSWADVLARYWQVRAQVPGVDVDTVFCAPPLRGLFPGSAEIALDIDDRPDRVRTGTLVTYTVQIQHFGGTTATILSILHTLSPSMTLHSAPAGCELTGLKLLCARPDLPPQATDSYQIVVRMMAPGDVPFSGQLSMLQVGGEPTANETTSVVGAPLVVGLGDGGVVNSLMHSTLRRIVLLFILAALLTVTYRLRPRN